MFVMVGPRAGEGARGWWPDVSWLYLKAMADAGAAVRAIPIGGAYLNVSSVDPAWRHWLKVKRLFASNNSLEADYVNVVCSPPGVTLGQRTTRGDMSPASMPELSNMEAGHPGAGAAGVHRQMLAAVGDKDPAEIMYDPGTALSTLWTLGKRNIAITGVVPKPPDRDETWALDRYDEVYAPTSSGAESLRLIGLDAMRVRPADLPDLVERILHGDSAA